MTGSTAIFWPVMAQILLIMIVYALLSRRRVAAVKAGRARVSQFRENLNEPEESLFVRNNLENQFQLPVIFYAVTIMLAVTGGASLLAVALAWVFVLSRYAHTYIHVTTNRIAHRRPLFIVGFTALGLMWLLLAVQLVRVGLVP